MTTTPTQTQISAGGVTFRQIDGRVEVALIAVGDPPRWQLPKGQIEPDEPAEITAVREVREETNLQTEVLDLIETVEYWYYSTRKGERIRYHKFVHFYLLRYTEGEIKGQAFETTDARWFEIDAAITALAFDSEKKAVKKAKEQIRNLG